VIAVVWQFQVRPGQQEAFEKFYGADGEWSRLARRSRSFLGSSFLRDHVESTHYLLIEYWSEMVVSERHKRTFATETASLDKQRNELCVSIVPMGMFAALDVPDRLGPTWSRRDGV
jgi:hypothetical protein